MNNNDNEKKKEYTAREMEERIRRGAIQLQHLMESVDVYTLMMTDEDLDILIECKDELISKMSRNASALPLIMALGGAYDETEDRFKAKTLNCIIELVRIRKEYADSMTHKKEMDELHQNLLKNILGG